MTSREGDTQLEYGASLIGRTDLIYWYRFEDVVYAPSLDEFDNTIPGSGRLVVRLLTFIVKRRTPKGVKLGWRTYQNTAWQITERFVRHDAVKKYAHPTLEEAKTSFIARKNVQKRIYSARVQRAESSIRMITAGVYEG